MHGKEALKKASSCAVYTCSSMKARTPPPREEGKREGGVVRGWVARP